MEIDNPSIRNLAKTLKRGFEIVNQDMYEEARKEALGEKRPSLDLNMPSSVGIRFNSNSIEDDDLTEE